MGRKGRLRVGLIDLIIYSLGLLIKTDISAPFTVNREENLLLQLSSGRFFLLALVGTCMITSGEVTNI